MSSAVRSDVVNCLLANFEESQHCGSETPRVTYLLHTSTLRFSNSFNTAGEDGAEVTSPLILPLMFIPHYIQLYTLNSPNVGALVLMIGSTSSGSQKR